MISNGNVVIRSISNILDAFESFDSIASVFSVS